MTAPRADPAGAHRGVKAAVAQILSRPGRSALVGHSLTSAALVGPSITSGRPRLVERRLGLIVIADHLARRGLTALLSSTTLGPGVVGELADALRRRTSVAVTVTRSSRRSSRYRTVRRSVEAKPVRGVDEPRDTPEADSWIPRSKSSGIRRYCVHPTSGHQFGQSPGVVDLAFHEVSSPNESAS